MTYRKIYCSTLPPWLHLLLLNSLLSSVTIIRLVPTFQLPTVTSNMSVPSTPAKNRKPPKKILSTPSYDKDDFEFIEPVDFTPRNTSTTKPMASRVDTGNAARTPKAHRSLPTSSHLSVDPTASSTPRAPQIPNEDLDDPR